MKQSLGVCYYPEHWDTSIWENDARQMKELGLSWVRIGEFAWKEIEPTEGQFNFEWLDKAIKILGQAGLKVVLGTPTATPPKWVLDKYPDMLSKDINGNIRGFGSRRHYCFSHSGYIEQCKDIVTRLAKRYGKNPYVCAWQTDNEYGCHDTTISYSETARDAFRTWLRYKYPGKGNDGDIEALNKEWGNVFWSMKYDNFDEINLPNLTVTEPNPAHILDFRRFSSDQVVNFNLSQVEIIKQYSNAPIAHNYMGRTTEFNHFEVGKSLDIASWDSYPLGFSEDRLETSDEEKRNFYRQGNPDFQAFHHDLYRAVGKGRWWIMEQQPGPVNWAPYNPAPLDGMVRLWTWEAFAHGAETVCYFRWRQAPFAQEQMHAGLLRPDSVPAQGYYEAKKVAEELNSANGLGINTAPIGIIFDYDADAMWDIQPQGKGLSYFGLIFDIYSSLRRLGFSIDFLSPEATNFNDYKLIIASGVMHTPDKFKELLLNSTAEILFGPRSNAKSENMYIETKLPPNLPKLDVTVDRVQTLRPDINIPLEISGNAKYYIEELEGKADDIIKTSSGISVLKSKNNINYLGSWLDGHGFDELFISLFNKINLDYTIMPYGVRRRETSDYYYWFNYNENETNTIIGSIKGADFVKIKK